MARCTFCSADLPAAPAGAAVRCPSCGNVTTTPALPRTLASAPGFGSTPPPSSALPFASVSGPKQGASPPPSVILPSRAGGVDELIGGGITILGIGLVKATLLGFLILGGACFLGMIGFALR